MTAGKIAMLIGLIAMCPLSCVRAQQDGPIPDKEIRVLEFEEMNYPHLAVQTHSRGLVVVRVKLDKDGNVSEATAISGSDLLIPDSLANVRKWRFQPNAQRTAVVVYHFAIPLAGCKSVNTFFTLAAPNLATITHCGMTVQE